MNLRYLFAVLGFTLCLTIVEAQESQSLADIARKIKSQKTGAQDNKSSPQGPTAAATPAPTKQPPEADAVAQEEEKPVIKPDLNANIASDIYGLEKYQEAIRQLLLQQKFEALDKLANEARSTKARVPGGYWKLHVIYSGLRSPAKGEYAPESEWTKTIDLLELWKKQYPASITARVALASAYNDYGHKARGSGYADSANNEGWRLLSERAARARSILEEAERLPTKCPEWFLTMQSVAMYQQWDGEQTNALFQKAISFEPDYYYYYRMLAMNLLPKWGGREGAVAKFADVVTMGRGKGADVLYYEIGAHVICPCDEESSLNGMSWSKLKAGYWALEERYGTSPEHMNRVAYMASVAGDAEFAKTMFDRIGDSWDPSVWPDREAFDYTRIRVEGLLSRNALHEARENAKTPEGQSFGTTLLASMNKEYGPKLQECMKTVPNYDLALVGVLMQLAKDGTPRKVIVAPTNAPITCFRPQLEKGRFATPPRADYWVVVDMPVVKP